MDTGAVNISTKRQYPLIAVAKRDLRTAFYRAGERKFYGYVVDTNDLSRKFSVEILVDGYSVRVVRADASVHALVIEQVGDGCYGFSCRLHDAIVTDSSVVEARLANLRTAVGTPIVLARPSDEMPAIIGPGTMRWLGGLRFSGWIAARDEFTAANVLVDGSLITQVRASTWSHVGTSEEDACAVRAFDFNLPNRFADGCIHRLALVDDARESLGGNPIVFLAYADGLREVRSPDTADPMRSS